MSRHDGWLAAESDTYVFPVIGGVYTVRDVGRGYKPHDDVTEACIRLVEIVNAPNQWNEEQNFLATRFHPIVARKTDISVFTEILRKATKPARTPAFS